MKYKNMYKEGILFKQDFPGLANSWREITACKKLEIIMLHVQSHITSLFNFLSQKQKDIPKPVLSIDFGRIEKQNNIRYYDML